MEIGEAEFRRNWRTTVAVCMAYVAILTLFGVVALYQVAPVAPDASQAKARPNAPSRGACFCVARPPPNIGEHRKGSMLAWFSPVQGDSRQPPERPNRLEPPDWKIGRLRPELCLIRALG